MSDLTHVDAAGHVKMVDVGEKPTTARTAVAHGHVGVGPDTLRRIADGQTPKGDVLATARLAGIMAAKRTADLIPLCHQIALSSVVVDIRLAWPEQRLEITATCVARDRTGVEMEALTAVSVTALTLYDMLKAVDHHMVIGSIQLLEKSGGRSGDVIGGVKVVSKQPTPAPGRGPLDPPPASPPPSQGSTPGARSPTPPPQANAPRRKGPTPAAQRRADRAIKLAADDPRLPIFLGRDPINSAYMLGDLDTPYAEHCEWYALVDEGALTAVLLVYGGLSVPTVLTAGDPVDVEAILAAFKDDLPRRFHGHIRPGHRAAVEAIYDFVDARPMMRMGLRQPEFIAHGDSAGVEVLGHKDTGALMQLYRHYPDNFFDPAQLDTGLYCGVRDAEGELISAAGVHVLSARHDVAAIGNIVTHIDHRGQGLASRCVRHMLDRLWPSVSHVALNVQPDNGSAVACYSKFGFVERFRFLEGWGVARG